MAPKRIGPYEIQERLGAGGMGEVYRAYDARLDRWVAVKLIRAEILDSATARQRFRREARTIARLTHPAIVQIHDVLEEEGTDGIVMELVEGETLSELLRRGPLAQQRAAALFREIGEGLAYAHGRGVVHRDLKAANVRVTPEGHAKILDFGLAKRLSNTVSEATLSHEGAILGTLDSMSPEQAQGLAVDHRSDLFSLGALLYRALTGETPFRGDNPRETLARVCMHRQKPVRALDPEIPPALSELVDRLLEKAPERRPQTAGEVTAALAEISGTGSGGAAWVEPPAPGDGSPRPEDTSTLAGSGVGAPGGGAPETASTHSLLSLPRHPRRLFALVAMLVVVVAVMVAMPWLRDAPPPETTSPATEEEVAPAPAVRPSVAVVPLENLSGRAEAAWLSTALAELVTRVLAAGGEIGPVRVLPRDMAVAPESARPRIETGLLVTGSYGFLEPDAASLLQVQLILEDAATGKVLPFEATTGTGDQLPDLVAKAARDLRRELGAEDLSPAQKVALKALIPGDPRPYFEGLERLRRLDAAGAKERLEAAAAADPEHPLPHAALARVWILLGHDREAEEAAAKAVELSGELPEDLRRRLEASHHETRYEQDQAVELYAELLQTHPGDLELGLRLATAQLAAASYNETLETLGTLRELLPPGAADPRLDLAQADTLYQQGEVQGSLDFALRAARSSEPGADLLAGRVLLMQGRALQDLGRYTDSEAALAEAAPLLEAAGDRVGVGKSLELKAFGALEQGELGGAWALLERALLIYRETGHRIRIAGVQATMASILLDRGELTAAEEMLRKALAVFRSLGAHREASIALNDIGIKYYYQGRFPQALEKYREALELLEKLGERRDNQATLSNYGEVLYLLGKLDDAYEIHQEALGICRENDERSGEAYNLLRLGMVLAAEGDFFAAREKYFAKALAQQERNKDVLAAAEIRLAWAEAELASGNSEDAERMAGEAEEIFRSEGVADLEALARTVRAAALLDSGRPEEARQALAGALALLETSEDFRVRLATPTVAARLRAASGEPADVDAALHRLRAVAAEAQALGLVGYELEARLAAAEIERDAGREGAGARLATLAADAEAAGYGSVAKRARFD